MIVPGRMQALLPFVYARWADRVHRIQVHQSHVTNVVEPLYTVDGQRTGYMRLHYGANRADLHLYHLIIDSMNRTERAAQLILSAMEMEPPTPSFNT
jgi:hypothetical protein